MRAPTQGTPERQSPALTSLSQQRRFPRQPESKVAGSHDGLLPMFTTSVDSNGPGSREGPATLPSSLPRRGRPPLALAPSATQRERLAHHPSRQPHQCPVTSCGQWLSTRHCLKTHLRRHSGEKPWICPEEDCQSRFRQRSNMERHRRGHIARQPFACPFEACGKGFATQRGYKEHMKMHTGGKALSCPVAGCQNRFHRRAHLQWHLEVHAGVRARSGPAAAVPEFLPTRPAAAPWPWLSLAAFPDPGSTPDPCPPDPCPPDPFLPVVAADQDDNPWQWPGTPASTVDWGLLPEPWWDTMPERPGLDWPKQAVQGPGRRGSANERAQP